MTKDTDKRTWPGDKSDLESLAVEIEPPKSLEDRVVNSLLGQGLIKGTRPSTHHSVGWRLVRASLAMAACVALLAIGVLIGRSSTAEFPGSLTTLTGSETDLYALLLVETPNYSHATGAAAMQRYSEYSQWVAYARGRDQFVAGEDFEVEEGWLLAPDEEDVVVSDEVAVDGKSPLSGIFFVRADDPDDAIEIASALPHIRHGGSVIVQKTIRTDVPPSQL